MGKPYTIDPTSGLIWTFDFSGEVPAGVSVTSFSISAPAPLTTSGKTDDFTNKTCKALISGAVHGAMYQVEGTAVLNNGETLNQSFSLRGWNK